MALRVQQPSQMPGLLVLLAAPAGMPSTAARTSLAARDRMNAADRIIANQKAIRGIQVVSQHSNCKLLPQTHALWGALPHLYEEHPRVLFVYEEYSRMLSMDTQIVPTIYKHQIIVTDAGTELRGVLELETDRFGRVVGRG